MYLKEHVLLLSAVAVDTVNLDMETLKEDLRRLEIKHLELRNAYDKYRQIPGVQREPMMDPKEEAKFLMARNKLSKEFGQRTKGLLKQVEKNTMKLSTDWAEVADPDDLPEGRVMDFSNRIGITRKVALAAHDFINTTKSLRAVSAFERTAGPIERRLISHPEFKMSPAVPKRAEEIGRAHV